MLSLFIPPPLPAFCDSVSVTDINDARSRFIGSLFTDFHINDARSHFIGSLFTDFRINDARSHFIGSLFTDFCINHARSRFIGSLSLYWFPYKRWTEPFHLIIARKMLLRCYWREILWHFRQTEKLPSSVRNFSDLFRQQAKFPSSGGKAREVVIG